MSKHEKQDHQETQSLPNSAAQDHQRQQRTTKDKNSDIV
jgi:hypothetical protein